jgi:hypothetical protein
MNGLNVYTTIRKQQLEWDVGECSGVLCVVLSLCRLEFEKSLFDFRRLCFPREEACAVHQSKSFKCEIQAKEALCRIGRQASCPTEARSIRVSLWHLYRFRRKCIQGRISSSSSCLGEKRLEHLQPVLEF